MKMFLSVLVFLVALSSAPTQFGMAQTPPAPPTAVVVVADDEVTPVDFKVEGPAKVKVGELAVMSIQKTGVKKVRWISLASTNNFLIVEDGQRAVFCSPVNGEFVFIVAGSVKSEPVLTIHRITVSGGQVSPVDPVDPTDAFAERIVAFCEQVQSPNKKQSTLMLAQSFSSVAAIMEGGSLTTPEEIVSATAKANRDALGVDLDAWKPLREGLAKELRAMSEDGKLVTPADHVEVWKSIASILREYAVTLP